MELEGKTYVYVELHELTRLKSKAHELDGLKAQMLAKTLKDSDHTEWQELAKMGQRAGASIKVRVLTGCSLTQALRLVDQYIESGCVMLSKELTNGDS